MRIHRKLYNSIAGIKRRNDINIDYWLSSKITGSSIMNPDISMTLFGEYINPHFIYTNRVNNMDSITNVLKDVNTDILGTFCLDFEESFNVDKDLSEVFNRNKLLTNIFLNNNHLVQLFQSLNNDEIIPVAEEDKDSDVLNLMASEISINGLSELENNRDVLNVGTSDVRHFELTTLQNKDITNFYSNVTVDDRKVLRKLYKKFPRLKELLQLDFDKYKVFMNKFSDIFSVNSYLTDMLSYLYDIYLTYFIFENSLFSSSFSKKTKKDIYRGDNFINNYNVPLISLVNMHNDECFINFYDNYNNYKEDFISNKGNNTDKVDCISVVNPIIRNIGVLGNVQVTYLKSNSNNLLKQLGLQNYLSTVVLEEQYMKNINNFFKSQLNVIGTQFFNVTSNIKQINTNSSMNTKNNIIDIDVNILDNIVYTTTDCIELNNFIENRNQTYIPIINKEQLNYFIQEVLLSDSFGVQYKVINKSINSVIGYTDIPTYGNSIEGYKMSYIERDIDKEFNEVIHFFASKIPDDLNSSKLLSINLSEHVDVFNNEVRTSVDVIVPENLIPNILLTTQEMSLTTKLVLHFNVLLTNKDSVLYKYLYQNSDINIDDCVIDELSDILNNNTCYTAIKTLLDICSKGNLREDVLKMKNLSMPLFSHVMSLYDTVRDLLAYNITHEFNVKEPNILGLLYNYDDRLYYHSLTNKTIDVDFLSKDERKFFSDRNNIMSIGLFGQCSMNNISLYYKHPWKEFDNVQSVFENPDIKSTKCNVNCFYNRFLTPPSRAFKYRDNKYNMSASEDIPLYSYYNKHVNINQKNYVYMMLSEKCILSICEMIKNNSNLNINKFNINDLYAEKYLFDTKKYYSRVKECYAVDISERYGYNIDDFLNFKYNEDLISIIEKYQEYTVVNSIYLHKLFIQVINILCEDDIENRNRLLNNLYIFKFVDGIVEDDSISISNTKETFNDDVLSKPEFKIPDIKDVYRKLYKGAFDVK